MYKTIIVHVDGSKDQESRLHAAALLADAFDAHVVGSTVTGLSWASYAMLAGPVYPALIDESFQALRESGRARLKAFEQRARGLGLESLESRLFEDEAGRALILQARFADLIVLGQDRAVDPGQPARPRGLPGQVVLEGARPVLVVPEAWQGQSLTGTIVVGWDGSLPAVRAIAGALPLLQRAQAVKLMVVNPPQRGESDAADPGADMAAYLARHGVPVEVVVERAPDGAGEALLARAEGEGASLIVAGAYGHARYREWALGGVTRDLLERARIPVLFAH